MNLNFSPENIAALIGIFAPLAVAFLASASWSSQAKGVAVLVVSAVIGFATAYATGSISAADIVGSILAAVGASQVAYFTVFKPVGLTSWILDNAGNTDQP